MAATSANASIPGVGDGVGAFFARCGVSPDAQDQCGRLARDLFPGARIEEATPQGYCSYTMCVGSDRILQFRPPAHKLRMAVADAACEVYGALAPKTQLLAVLRVSHALHPKRGDPQPVDEGVVMDDDQVCFDVVSMARIPGTSLAEHRALTARLRPPPAQVHAQRAALVCAFARLVATSTRRPRPRPASDGASAAPHGRVGRTLRWRLEQLCAHLPARLRPAAGRALAALADIAAVLPWVLTHGDLVPANIMVAPPRLVVAGLVDWAEAEYLPLGVGFYGLEELLGEDDAGGRFAYYADEEALRGLFWAQVEAELAAAGLVLDTHSRQLVGAAHTLGVLLWHGIAFDDGKLDRVVREGVDDAEILRLDLFLARASSADTYTVVAL